MNTTTERGTPRRFFRTMLYIALIAVLLISIGTSVFYVYMAAYEHSRPSFALKNYIENINMNHIIEISEDIVSKVDKNTQSTQESYEKIYFGIKNAQYVKNLKESNEYQTSYILRDDDILLENVVLTLGKPGLFGFIPWAVEKEEMLESSLCSRVKVTVPKGYKVEVGGNELGHSSVVNDRTPYQILEGFYELYDGLPTLVEYDTGEFIGKPDFRVLDPNGNEVTPEEYSEDTICNNCTEDEIAAIDDLMKPFVEKYVAYKSSPNGSAAFNLYEVTPFCVQGGEMENRLKMALGGLSYASSRGDTVTDISINKHFSLGDGRYVCELTYTVETTGSNAVHSTHTYSSRFYLLDTEKGLRVEAESTF